MPYWIDLEGLANLRDVGGMPTTDGGAIASGRLLRSDNLQTLTPRDIAELRGRRLTDVIDLRSDVEANSEGPGPITSEQGITIHHHSLFRDVLDGAAEPERSAPGEGPEPVEVESNPAVAGGSERAVPTAEAYSAVAVESAPGAVSAAALPWVGLEPSAAHHIPDTSFYLSYLADRPDSVLSALRAIGDAQGAALVHCAAGKDRTGTIVALALLVAGAEPDAVIADYAASSDRVEQIVRRLLASPTYADNLRDRPLDSHRTRPETMRAFIDYANAEYGSAEQMLVDVGWTRADSAKLRAKLRD
jgi:protein-tyrosine phosphatase